MAAIKQMTVLIHLKFSGLHDLSIQCVDSFTLVESWIEECCHFYHAAC